MDEPELETEALKELAPVPLPCPVCGLPMIRHSVHGIELDLCNDHGTWLEGQRLGEIVERIQAESRAEANSRARRSKRRQRARERRAKAGLETDVTLAALIGALLS